MSVGIEDNVVVVDVANHVDLPSAAGVARVRRAVGMVDTATVGVDVSNWVDTMRTAPTRVRRVKNEDRFLPYPHSYFIAVCSLYHSSSSS